MKKLLVVLLVLGLIGGGVFFWLSKNPDKMAEVVSKVTEVAGGKVSDADVAGFADYLPADTIAVFSYRNLNGLVERFPQTALGEFLAPDTVGAMMQELGAMEEDIQEYRKGYENIFSNLNDPTFKMLMGDDFELAVLPFDLSLIDDNPEEAVRTSLVGLATVSSADTVMNFARNLMGKDAEKVNIGELELTKIVLEDDEYLYVATDDKRVLMALKPEVIEKCLAQKKSGNGLAQVDNFINGTKVWQNTKIDNPYMRVFAQIASLSDAMKSFGEKNETESSKFLKQVGDYWQGIDFWSMVWGRDDKSSSWQVEISEEYDYEKLHHTIKSYIDGAAKPKNTLHLASGAPLLFFEGVGIDAQFKSALEQMYLDEEAAQEMKAEVEAELGMPMEKAVEAFGSRWAFVLNGINVEGMFPLPRMAMALEVNDKEVMKSLLDKLIASIGENGMEAQKMDKEGKEIYYFPLTPGEIGQPAFSLSDNMLYIGNGPTSIGNYIANEKNSNTLDQETGKILGSDLADKMVKANAASGFMFPKRFADSLKPVLEWATGMFGMDMPVTKREVLKLIGSSEVIFTEGSMDKKAYTGWMMVKDNKEAVEIAQ